jgi:hypothetical protein
MLNPKLDNREVKEEPVEILLPLTTLIEFRFGISVIINIHIITPILILPLYVCIMFGLPAGFSPKHSAIQHAFPVTH